MSAADPLAAFRGPDGELCPRTNLERELDHQAAALESEDLTAELELAEFVPAWGPTRGRA